MAHFTGERTLMRIFVSSRQRCLGGPHAGKPLAESLSSFFRESGFAGVTVLHGITGFGASARMHAPHLLSLKRDVPVVIEVVETEGKIQEVLPELDAMIPGGLVTLEKVQVIVHRPANAPENERWKHQVEGLHPAADVSA
jgi:uncharacterized protein